MTKKRIGITRFWGTNCDRDVWRAVESLGYTPEWWWQDDGNRPTLEEGADSDVAGIVIPGGFSYGDYLRAGALASRQPVMKRVRAQAEAGKPVLGICNGFQILCEAQLLPGVLVKNEKLKFVDKWVELEMRTAGHESGTSDAEEVFSLPVAHGMGRFVMNSEAELDQLFSQGQVWLTYRGQAPNGSLRNIAGVKNERGNVWGLMPHPERAMEAFHGCTDGSSVLQTWLKRAGQTWLKGAGQTVSQGAD